MRIDRQNKPLSATLFEIYQKYIIGVEEDKPVEVVDPEERLFSNPVTELDISLIEFLKEGKEPEIEESQIENIGFTFSLPHTRVTKK